MKRNVLNSPRLTELKKRRRKAVLNKILLSLLGLVIVFFLFTYLSHLKNLNIVEIRVVSDGVVGPEEIKETVKGEITGKYLYLFPKTNILIYPQSSIKDELQSKFKRIKSVDLSIEDNKTLFINITERVAKYTWCGDTPVLGAELPREECYFLDEEGYIFDVAPYFSGEVYFKFFGIPTSEDNYFFKQNFRQLASFKDALVKLGLKPTSLYVASDGDVEVTLLPGSSATTLPKIIFKLDADMQNIKENLDTALKTEPLKSDFKKKYSSLEYIDLRFGNKVYSKFSK